MAKQCLIKPTETSTETAAVPRVQRGFGGCPGLSQCFGQNIHQL